MKKKKKTHSASNTSVGSELNHENLKTLSRPNLADRIESRKKPLEFSSSTIQEAFGLLLNKLSKIGIQYVFYGICVKHSPGKKRVWGYYGNYPDEFKNVYIGENWLNYDPTLKSFLVSGDTRPVIWNYPEDTERNETLTKDELKLEKLAWDCGLMNGATIPLRLDRNTSQPLSAAAICAPDTMKRSEWNRIWKTHRWDIENALDQFHDQVVSIPDFENQIEVNKDYRELFNEMISVVKYGAPIENLDRTLETIAADLDETPPDKRVTRLHEICEYARAHVYKTLGSTFDLPKDREKYKAREDKSETATAFFKRVWGDLLKENRVYQFNLRPIDPTLVRAVDYEAKKDEGRCADYIPTKQVSIDHELAAFKAVNRLKTEMVAKKGGPKAAKRESTRLSVNKRRRNKG